MAETLVAQCRVLLQRSTPLVALCCREPYLHSTPCWRPRGPSSARRGTSERQCSRRLSQVMEQRLVLGALRKRHHGATRPAQSGPGRPGTVSPASLWRRCLSALHNAATEVCTMRVFCADRKSRGAFTSSSACTCRAKNIIPRRRAFLSLKSNAKSPLCSPAWPRGAGSVQAACVRWAVVAMATTGRRGGRRDLRK